MLCPSLLSSKSTDPEQCLSDQQIDRTYLINRMWGLVQETDRTRKNGLTEKDYKYFDNILTAIECWSDEELLDLASEPTEFRKMMREW
ncbi:hypothetical protein BCT62_21115 [Vibrio splendidus]|uniref:hypothetical protein n=1 Tax=Vibrio splendidus TaxID=29497 RepID=UPI000C83B93F|nr:hypothetical protein [Vibrio splendidus]PMM04642.1 hypothetical protein BCT62_21115 [Vibrio splendidus]